MDTPLNKDLTNHVVGKNYKLIKKLGAGAFGEIYLTEHKVSNEQFAIKLEMNDTKHPQIFFEAKLYNYLQSSTNGETGIPRIYGQGTEGQYNYMIMDLLGMSLEDLFTKNNRKFSIKTVLMLGDQMLQRVEFLHQRQFLHRDIKPDNFLMGFGKRSHRVYIVDFGLAKRYLSKEGHIPYKSGKSLTGTARYASINTHMGIEQSRRDDLESIGYVLLYFLRGQLPWQNMKATNQKDKYEKIMEKKVQTSAEVLCKGFPDEFVTYLNYAKQLKFEEKPDYVFLRGLFKEAMRKGGIENDYKYDWVKLSELPPSQPTVKEDVTQQFTSSKQVSNVKPNMNGNARHSTDEKKINTLLSSQKLPPPTQQQTQQRPPTKNQSVEKGRNTSIKQTSSRNLNSLHNQLSSNVSTQVQQQTNKVPQPKIVTTKEYYRK